MHARVNKTARSVEENHRVIPSASMHTGHYYITALVHCSQAYLAHETRYPTLLLTCAMVHGICALESSSYVYVIVHRVQVPSFKDMTE